MPIFLSRRQFVAEVASSAIGLAVVPVILIAICTGETRLLRAEPVQLRVATFNVALHRPRAGELIHELESGNCLKAKKLAEIIQSIRPHVILINELDYDQQCKAARLFNQKYLAVSQNGHKPLVFPYFHAGPVNTGVPSTVDLNKDGVTEGPADAFGYGMFPGQYGMTLFAMFPIQQARIRTFQTFLWKDMPGALLPIDPKTGQPYYSSRDLAVLRLSSKGHWDIPLQIGRNVLHVLASHPTPPVFDGPEDRNGSRNHDEIRFWADYVLPDRSQYIYDDQGVCGGLAAGSHFVVLGDLNADPQDGASRNRAVCQLTEHPAFNHKLTPRSEGAAQQAVLQGGVNHKHRGDAASDTCDFSEQGPGNLRVDYVLPSNNLSPRQAGVYWPRTNEPGFHLIDASDHRLVWVDIEVSCPHKSPSH
ncbi:MAG: endonuclease [Planctomycetaceae bacterium]|nr:endonuclease [Planctomycetaceae bacterium]MBP60835.1 endonuclease [Planctomycetaceae bacterium]